MANLVVCCDGTWNTPDDTDGGLPAPTNVWKFHNAVDPKDAQGIEQQNYYHPGVGTDGSWWDKALGGGAGAGLARNVKSAYQWLATHYSPGDRIFLIGFSRGAYTVRSLGGMIVRCGLLDLAALSPDEAWRRVDLAFGCYRNKETSAEFRKLKIFDSQPGADPRGTTKIFCIGVWDTVGALGIPDDMALLNLLDDPKKHSFHDTMLSPSVLNALHAVAIDEQRQTFTPTFWENVDNRPEVKQVWFPGVHSDVGGGYGQVGLSDGALHWMMSETAALGLKFRDGVEKQLRPDCLGILHDSFTGVFKALKSCPRNVPNFNDPKAAFHPSSRDRFANPPIQQGVFWPTSVLAVGQSRSMDIFAREHWNFTRLYLEGGGEYQLTATGQWVDGDVKCGPDGTNDGKFHLGEVAQLAASAFGQFETLFRKTTGNLHADFWWTKRVEAFDWFSLVGVVANGFGTDNAGNPIPHMTFKIGDGCKVALKAGEGGYLYCFANDAWQAYLNNKGSVNLTVRRTA
jgi:hypothetical protein